MIWGGWVACVHGLRDYIQGQQHPLFFLSQNSCRSSGLADKRFGLAQRTCVPALLTAC
jgi:hypothetical protein